MKPLQIQFPPYIRQFDAYLAFLADPEEYAKLHKQITDGVDRLNERLKKLKLASDLDAVLAAAEQDRLKAKNLLHEAKGFVQEVKEENEAAQVQRQEAAAILLAREKALKKATAVQAQHEAQHVKEVAETQRDFEAQHVQIAREMQKARTLQDEAQARLDRIDQFKEAV